MSSLFTRAGLIAGSCAVTMGAMAAPATATPVIPQALTESLPAGVMIADDPDLSDVATPVISILRSLTSITKTTGNINTEETFSSSLSSYINPSAGNQQTPIDPTQFSAKIPGNDKNNPAIGAHMGWAFTDKTSGAICEIGGSNPNDFRLICHRSYPSVMNKPCAPGADRANNGCYTGISRFGLGVGAPWIGAPTNDWWWAQTPSTFAKLNGHQPKVLSPGQSLFLPGLVKCDAEKGQTTCSRGNFSITMTPTTVTSQP